MRRIVVLALLLLAMGAAKAQETWVLDSVYCRTNDWNTNTTVPDVWRKYAYDSMLRDTQELIWRYNIDNSGFEPSERTSKTYNNQDQLVASIRWIYDRSGWRKNGKVDYQYTASGRVEKLTNSFWDGSAWTPRDRTVFSYNADDSLTEMLQEMYSSMQWSAFNKTEIKFNGRLRTEWLQYTSNGSSLDTSNQRIYTYHNQLLESRKTRYNDFGKNRMIDALIDSFSYDQGKQVAHTQYLYSDFSKEWTLLLIDSFSYPAPGEKVKTQFGNFGRLMPSIRVHSYADANGNDTLEERLGWNLFTTSWDPQSRRRKEYTSRNELSYELNESYDGTSNTWTLQFDCKYMYRQVVQVGMVKVEEHAPEVRISQQGVYLLVASEANLQSISVFDLEGKLVAQSQGARAQQVRCKMPSGSGKLFIIHIQGDDWLDTRKLWFRGR